MTAHKSKSSHPESLPSFRLQSNTLQTIGPEDYKERKNLVLAFVDGPRCATCGQLINNLMSRYSEIMNLNAEILAVLSPRGSTEVVQTRYKPPFPVLFDPDERAAAACLGAEGVCRPAVIVTDRFGTIWLHRVPTKSRDALNIDEILEILRFIQMPCHERGIPDEPPLPQQVRGIIWEEGEVGESFYTDIAGAAVLMQCGATSLQQKMREANLMPSASSL